MVNTPAFRENPQYGVGQFGANAAFDGLLGLRYSWGTTFGLVLPNIDAALSQLGRGSTASGVNLFSPSGKVFTAASLKMLEEIGHGLTHTQAAAAERYVTEAWALEGIGAVIERVAEDAVQTRKLIGQRSKPREIIRVVRPQTRAQLQPVARQAQHAEDRAQAAERKTRALDQRVARLERTIAKPHAVAWPGIPGRVGRIEREIDRLKGRAGKIGKYASLGAFLLLLAKALEKMGLNWIRCGNVKRFGRRVCGMDASALDTLLNGTLLIVGTVGLVEFAKGMQSVMDEIEPPVRKFWRATT